MGKNILRRKVRYREKAIIAWVQHYPEATTNEKKIFKIGFNAGWKCKHHSVKGLPT